MNIKLKKIIHFLISLPISIWINFKVFPFRTAILLPIIIDYRTSIYGHGLQKEVALYYLQNSILA